MSITRVYIPQTREKHPAVIGFPGFVHAYEENRMDNIFRELQRQGIEGIRVSYSDIKWLDNGRRIICPINLETAERDVSSVLEHIRKNRDRDNFDDTRIGILASSIGAGIFGQYFGKQPPTNPGIKSYVAISPIPGWKQYATEEARRQILDSRRDLDISSQKDKERGIKRIIPHSGLKELEKLDSIRSLEIFKNLLKKHPKTLTFRGEKDKLASREAMMQYHQLMGGKLEDFLELPTEHDIPESEINQLIIDFFVKSLR